MPCKQSRYLSLVYCDFGEDGKISLFFFLQDKHCTFRMSMKKLQGKAKGKTKKS